MKLPVGPDLIEELREENERLRDAYRDSQNTVSKCQKMNSFLQDALIRVKCCPYCDDVGFYIKAGREGEPEQIQCEFCYNEPNSKFNLIKKNETK